MLRQRTLIVLCSSAVSIAACGSLWSRANVGALQSDLQALFEQTGIQIPFQSCDMVGTTRTGYCRFIDRNGIVEALTQAYDLVPVPFENATIAFIDAELEAGCGSFPSILEGSEGILYLTSGRPQNLRLPNGSAFEYMLLLYSTSSGEACIQASYAYG